VAGILHHLGIPMGEFADPKYSAPASNPKGQFEDNDAVALMRLAMGNWWVPRTEFWPETVMDDLVKHINSRAEQSPIWGIKSPQLCMFARYLLPEMDEPRVIFTHRRFEDSVASIVARDKFPEPVAEAIMARYWLQLYETRAFAHSRKIPYADSKYPKMLEDPEDVVAKIADFAFDGTDYQPTKAQLQAAVDFIEPDLCHHKP